MNIYNSSGKFVYYPAAQNRKPACKNNQFDFVFSAKLKNFIGNGAAIAAYGAFFIPKLFGLSYATQGSVIPAFYFLIGFTVLTIFITWFFYARKGSGIKC